jgi:hypothetical protein
VGAPLADDLEYCSDIVRRHVDKGAGMVYFVGNALCSWAELCCACACRSLDCVSRRLRYSQTTYVDRG